MNQPRRFPRKARWAVPAGAIAAAGLVIAGSMLASAQAAPALPGRSTAQLLAGVRTAGAVPSALSGVIVETAALGLPQLPDTGGGASASSLLAGTHTVKFWYAGPQHVRIAIPVSLGETDLRRDGRQIWLWDSTTNTATHIVPPARPGTGPGLAPPAGMPSFGLQPSAGGNFPAGWPSPQQAARQVLAAVGPTTTVSVQRSVMVAGQAAYQLVIAPKASGSLVGQIRIAIDSRGYLPLRLQVFARGAASPAYQVGYTSLSFAPPAAANFAFTPPPGAKVKTVKIPGPGSLPGLPGSLPPGATRITVPGGTGSAIGRQELQLLRKQAVRERLQVLRKQEARERQRLLDARPNGRSAAEDRAALKLLRRDIRLVSGGGRRHLAVVVPGPSDSGWYGYTAPGMPQGAQTRGPLAAPLIAQSRGSLDVPPLSALSQGTPSRFGAGRQSAAPRVFGQDWLSVVELHLNGLAQAGLLGGSHPPSAPRARATFGSAAPASGQVIAQGPPGQVLMVLGAMLRAATPVHGSWGSGRLLRTSLLSVLVLGNGRVLLGAVTPAVLYADAAKAK